MEDKTQPVTEHLGELRRRLIWVIVVFVLGLVVGFVFAADFVHWLKQQMPANVTMHVFSPAEPLRVYMMFAFVISAVITLPVAFYQLWAFVKPGLTKTEQRITLTYIPFAVILFCLGLLFGFYVIFPYLIRFMTGLSAALGTTETFGIYRYFGFMFNIVFPLGLFFELPLVILFLTRLRILRPDLLRRGRRAAYLGMVILAAVITPPDLVSNILVSIPLILLYEISLFLCTWLYRRIQKEDEAREKTWLEES
ncbi:sec-independent protein translocase protein TatC [Planifilum fimeticola]|jgi:sec-independent protein translocase protein TatC|uniref:Sec-independent protein translocase protein TatC n=1 Tax=Planifilum fimeticola TaxID=201975 RepID=A0A2T0LC99_9BACL|nr:twin-arginine translocase subunit TatC [Planifilum fimeticola]PRX39628.1 sec-independent protein translocase protein TatC [Planifilum fimeticola]